MSLMKLTPVTLDLNLAQTGPSTRSSGLHVSDIYNDLYKTLQPSRYAKKRLFTPTTPNEEDFDPMMVGLGLAWETHLEKVLHAAGVKAERPGEFTTAEGIPFTPDLLVDNGHTATGEIKFTRYKMGDYRDEKFAKWITQMKTYCYHLGTPYARLFALHLNGDYRTHRDPTLVITDFEFTATELKREWAMLLSHARQQRLLSWT